MNRYDVEDAIVRYRQHEILGPAVRTLGNLVEWTDSNSDGWPYWKKPGQAAKKLMDIIERKHFGDRDDVTVSEIRAAYRPIKSFRTRQGADFTVEEL